MDVPGYRPHVVLLCKELEAPRRALERATIGLARRQIVQALTNLGAQFQNDTRRGSRRHERGL